MLIEGFYKIISKKEEGKDNYTVGVKLNADHQIYKAHFPENPVTPGVCIVQILKDIVCAKVKKELVFNKITNIKFLHVINPLDTPEIDFNIKYSETENGYKVNVTVTDTEKIYTKISGFLNE